MTEYIPIEHDRDVAPLHSARSQPLGAVPPATFKFKLPRPLAGQVYYLAEVGGYKSQRARRSR
jgi:hypothetical protein